jgi:uracil-DNA glycosylase
LDNSGKLQKLKEEALQCTRCKLSTTRTKVVFGEGNPNADILFIGEGPGKTEDATGRPFVGRAGELLTRIIENGMGLSRNDVYIANIVKCRNVDRQWI